MINAEELLHTIANATMLEYFTRVQTLIPDNAVDIKSAIEITELLIVEHVEVVVDIHHPRRGDLEIELLGPTGTHSQLTTLHYDTHADYANWTLMSLAHWDETSIGEWMLTIRDKNPHHTGVWISWRLRVWGTQLNPY